MHSSRSGCPSAAQDRQPTCSAASCCTTPIQKLTNNTKLRLPQERSFQSVCTQLADHRVWPGLRMPRHPMSSSNHPGKPHSNACLGRAFRRAIPRPSTPFSLLFSCRQGLAQDSVWRKATRSCCGFLDCPASLSLELKEAVGPTGRAGLEGCGGQTDSRRRVCLRVCRRSHTHVACSQEAVVL